MLVTINGLSWEKAVTLAIEAGRIYGVKQRVYKSRFFGWIWTSTVDDEGWHL